MGNKFTRSTEDSNLFCILYLMRIGVLVPAIKTNEVHDFYHEHIHNLERSEQIKYNPIVAMRGYILRDCKDYTLDYVRKVNVIEFNSDINWYHVALQFCEHDFDIDNTETACRRLRRDSPSAKALPFVGESQAGKPDKPDKANVWYHMNQTLDKYEPRPIPQYRK